VPMLSIRWSYGFELIDINGRVEKDLYGSAGDKARCPNIRLNRGSILITIMKVIFRSIIIITIWQLECQEQPIKILKNIHVKLLNARIDKLMPPSRCYDLLLP
jgi:hypothetical protein